MAFALLVIIKDPTALFLFEYLYLLPFLFFIVNNEVKPGSTTHQSLLSNSFN